MADPTRYERDYSFSGYQSTNPSKPLPGPSLDNELENIEASLNSTITGLMDIRRSDGALKNGIVTAASLSPEISSGVAPAVPWVADHLYSINDVVFYDTTFYRALVDHISTIFANDLALGRWAVVADLTPIVTDAVAAKDAAEAAAATATTQAGIATTGAATATTQAGIATTQAGIATTGAGTATTQAGIATAAASAAAASADSFEDAYLGDKTTLPTLDNDGDALQEGALCFLTDQVDPDDDGLYRWNGTTWLLISTAPQAIEREGYEVVTVDGTTTITVPDGYQVGRIKVFHNGSKFRLGASPVVGDPNAPGATASNGTQIVFPANFLLAGDLVEWIITKPFTAASVVAADVGFTPAGGLAATNVQTALVELDTEKAPLASPALTGVPTAPTAALGTNTTQLASTAFVKAALDALVDTAPGTLDTLNELAAALGDDPNFAATMTAALAAKAPLASPTFTGSPAAPTPSPGDNDTSIATTAFVTAAIAAASSTVVLPLGYLAGMQLANNVADATNDIDITAGVVRDSTNTVTISGTAMTKRLDAVWAAGTNQGGLDTGAKANSTWYYVFAIAKAGGADPDYLFSTSQTAPTLPATYTVFRRIGAIRTNGSGVILAFLQSGDSFSLAVPTTDYNSAPAANTTTAVTLTVPPLAGIHAVTAGWVLNAASGINIYVFRTGSDPFSGAHATVRTQVASVWATFAKTLPVDGSGQIQVRASAASTSIFLFTEGWLDRRGRDA
jgi:hypothetical protein